MKFTWFYLCWNTGLSRVEASYGLLVHNDLYVVLWSVSGSTACIIYLNESYFECNVQDKTSTLLFLYTLFFLLLIFTTLKKSLSNHSESDEVNKVLQMLCPDMENSPTTDSLGQLSWEKNDVGQMYKCAFGQQWKSMAQKWRVCLPFARQTAFCHGMLSSVYKLKWTVYKLNWTEKTKSE